MNIDMGCGKHKLDGFFGIDIDPNSHADLVTSALDIPLEDECADKIVANHLVEHFAPKEAQKFFNECWRLLKKGGTINMKVDKDWTEKRLLTKDPTHKYRYTAKELESMLGKYVSFSVKDKMYFYKIHPRRKIFITGTK